MTITIGHYLTVAHVPLSRPSRSDASHRRGEGWGEGAVIDPSMLGTPPSPGAEVGPRFSIDMTGRAGLSPRGEAQHEAHTE